MATSQLTLLAVLSLAVMAQGEKVILKVEHPELNGNSQCILPPTLTVKIERQDGGREIPELFLSQSGVAPPSSHVKIMQVDPQGDIRLDHHEIHEPKVLQSQAYHNHSIGASFIVSCVLSDIEKMYFRLEGSIYVDSSKYRLTPEILDEEDDSIQFEFEHVAVMYSMTPVLELSSYNCGVQYHGSDVDTSSGKVIYPGKADAIEYPFSSSSSRIKDSDTDDLGVSNLHRHRRDSNTNAVYYVDILPVIDYSTYSLWYDRNPNEDEVKKMLNTYLINTLSAVEMRLQTLQLGGTKLRVKMVSPIISTDPSTSPFTEDIKVSVNGSLKVIAPQLLSTFSQWVENNRDSLPPNDHMMLFTSYDLIPNNITDGTASSIIKGLAKVGALCTNGSVSLIEDKGAYQSENVAAHELGHSLGSNHDGDDNACKPADRYMMSPKTFPQKDSNLLHPWQFSTCSSDAIAAYIKSLEASDIPRISCLLKQLGVNVSNELSLTAHEICKMSYGNTAFPCMYPTNFSEICTKLSCRTIENPMCTLMVPPTGTCCGNGKSCLAGLCVDDDSQGKCVVDEECPLGDQPILQINDDSPITCNQLNLAFCYDEDVRKTCCVTCRNNKTDDTSCPYGDRADCSSVTDFAQCEVEKDKCCGTCNRLAPLQTTTATTASNGAGTTTAAEPITAADTTTSAEPTTAADTTTTAEPTTVADTSTAAEPTTTAAPPANPTTVTTQVVPFATTTTEEAPGNVYGYKPDGFVGCYLPPCSAGRLFCPYLLYALLAVCLLLGHLSVTGS